MPSRTTFPPWKRATRGSRGLSVHLRAALVDFLVVRCSQLVPWPGDDCLSHLLSKATTISTVVFVGQLPFSIPKDLRSLPRESRPV
ncbi:hypothetical protein BV25DRAFT_1469010 [Artomyces pyxidatus]|uniref:Uncharacterized protein n=1 Tax=Artomyces pyxidatus TaxID=48021 RepID=A0ACB8SL08_9AGAM|nr:hypothetical protein BV25DRAFT_1469010 [Artomyces pyxidatus]